MKTTSKIKITNKSRIVTADLRALAKAAVAKICKCVAIEFVFISWVTRKTSLAVNRRYFVLSDSFVITISIPHSLYKDLDRLARSLGAHLHYHAYQAAFGESPEKTDWLFGSDYPLRLLPEKPVEKKPVVVAREEKAHRRIALLEARLAALQAQQQSVERSLKKARAKVVYYQKRKSKAAQELDFQKRLKDKLKNIIDERGTP